MSQIKYNNKTIKKLEYNASEVNKMYYNDNVAYGVDDGSQPPLYNEYEYIKTVGTATTRYTFNTGFYPTTAHTIELKIQLTDNSVDWGRIFGWSSCSSDNCDSTQYRFTTVTRYWALAARRGNTKGTIRETLNKDIDITCTIPISSTTYWSFTTGTSSVSTNVNINSGTFDSPSTTPLHLLGFGDNTWGSRGSAHLKYYYLKVYDENHNLVKHYVASDYNGVPCFYEKVNGEYIIDTYTGSDHGTLTLGNPVN